MTSDRLTAAAWVVMFTVWTAWATWGVMTAPAVVPESPECAETRAERERIAAYDGSVRDGLLAVMDELIDRRCR